MMFLLDQKKSYRKDNKLADQRIQYTECMVGNGHPSKPDTLNRFASIALRNDGSLRDTDYRGTRNVSVGFMAGTSITTGIHNTFIGVDSGFSNTTGKFNTFVGYEAGEDTTAGLYNTALGYRSLGNGANGEYNTFAVAYSAEA